MNVYLSFDIEVCCNGWDQLESAFPAAFERYIYGHSRQDGYALPKTLEILNRHGLRGVFFVEPLFAARFGLEPLQRIVGLIRSAGQEVQLHLHPEWTDEALEPLIPDCQRKRQHLSYYTLDEQTALIAHGQRLLQAAGSGPLTAFRAGSYAANRDTYTALARNQIWLDSSLNRCGKTSGLDLREGARPFELPLSLDGVTSLPISVFRDGFGRDRPAQVGACGASELAQALRSARAAGRQHFVIVSHNFEMLRAGSTQPDRVVVRRFEALCAHLARESERYTVRGMSEPVPLAPVQPTGGDKNTPQVGWWPTAQRHAEQLQRRLYR